MGLAIHLVGGTVIAIGGGLLLFDLSSTMTETITVHQFYAMVN